MCEPRSNLQDAEDWLQDTLDPNTEDDQQQDEDDDEDEDVSQTDDDD
jgi:hypothetical protein